MKANPINDPKLLELIKHIIESDEVKKMRHPVISLNIDDYFYLKSLLNLKPNYFNSDSTRINRVRIEFNPNIEPNKVYIFDIEDEYIRAFRVCFNMYLINQKNIKL